LLKVPRAGDCGRMMGESAVLAAINGGGILARSVPGPVPNLSRSPRNAQGSPGHRLAWIATRTGGRFRAS
jgi:hypothetical protein